MGRPRVLDEGKQREVCALLTAGMTMGEAAAYVGCCEKTIRREQRRDEAFDERVRHARMAARLGPLQAVRQAAATHWRAAAWLVDRQDRQEERERRARRERDRRRQQRAKAKRKQPRWDLEQEIQQIASARPPQATNAVPPKGPRSQPAEPASAPAKPAAPVAAALSQIAKQVAASVGKQQEAAANGDSTRRTKPAVRLAEQPAAGPCEQGANASGGDSGGGGFVPSLRLFGQNDHDEPNAGDVANSESGADPTASAAGCREERRGEPPASAGGGANQSAARQAGCSGG